MCGRLSIAISKLAMADRARLAGMRIVGGSVVGSYKNLSIIPYTIPNVDGIWKGVWENFSHYEKRGYWLNPTNWRVPLIDGVGSVADVKVPVDEIRHYHLKTRQTLVVKFKDMVELPALALRSGPPGTKGLPIIRIVTALKKVGDFTDRWADGVWDQDIESVTKMRGYCYAL